MPVFFVALVAALSQAAGSLAGRVMLALGFQLVTFTGLEIAFGSVTDLIASSWGSLPGDIAGMAGYMRLDDGVAMIVAAVTTRMVLSGITSGTFTRLVSR